MDQATALKILQNQGAPPTPENLNRVMAAQNQGRGTELLGRSLGLQGGSGEEGPGMDLMLDKMMKSTSTPSQMPVDHEVAVQDGARPGRVEVGAPVRVPGPSRQGNYGPGSSPSRQGNYGPGANGTVDPNAPKNTVGMELVTLPNGQQVYQPKVGIEGVVGTRDENPAPTGLDWLLAALGLSAAGAARGTAPPIAPPSPQLTGPNAPAQIEGANPNQKRLTYEPKLTGPNPQLPDQSGPKMESGAPVPPKQPVGGPAAPQTPDDIARIQAEIDAENAALKAKEAKANANARGKGAGAKGAEGNTKSLIDALKAFRSMR